MPKKTSASPKKNSSENLLNKIQEQNQMLLMENARLKTKELMSDEAEFREILIQTMHQINSNLESLTKQVNLCALQLQESNQSNIEDEEEPEDEELEEEDEEKED